MDPMQNQLCRVCDEPAAGFHFGAFTCEGCKSFFGRTCNNQSVIAECKNNYRCVVDKKNRTSCKACRLRKCLMVGMSKSGSRYGRRSNWFKIHCLMQQNSTPSNSDPTVGAHAWTSARKDDLTTGQTKDSSFGSQISRSPSPNNISLNTSLESLSQKSSLPSPTKRESLSPVSISASNPTTLSPPVPGPLPMSSLYPSPVSPISPMFPFYKLSPLLAAHNPLLANPFLLSLAGQHHHQQQQQQQQQLNKSHLDLLAEHRELLAKFGAARSAAIAAATASVASTSEATSPIPTTTDSPIDLSVKFSATTCLIRPPSSPPSPSSPNSSAPDDEGIEVDIGDKSDAARNLLMTNNFEGRRDNGAVLDLTVSS